MMLRKLLLALICALVTSSSLGQVYNQTTVPFSTAPGTWIGNPTTSQAGPTAYPAGQLASGVSLLTAATSPSLEDRYMIFSGQEASVYLNGGVYNVLYTDGSGYVGWRYCNGDPTLSSCWSAETVVIGNTHGGVSTTAKHGFTYIEGSTIYQYFVDTSNNTDVATAPMPGSGTTAPTFSYVGTVLGPQGTGSGQGNMAVIKYSGTYYMWQESLQSVSNPTEGTSHIFLIGSYTGATATGTFTVATTTLTTLKTGPNGGAGGPWVYVANATTAVMIYHCQPWGRMVVSELCRATIPLSSLSADSWTITNGGQGSSTNEVNPYWMHRAAFLEYDQLADPTVFTGPNGVTYLMYTAAKNNGDGEGAGWFYQMITPLVPGATQVDGSFTHNVYGFPGYDPKFWDVAIPDFYVNTPGLSAPVSTSGTWSAVTNTSQNGGVLYTNTSVGSTDQATWRVSLLPGTYKLTVNYATGPGNGIAEFQIYDCVNHTAGNIVNVDGYAASATYNVNTTGTLYVLGYEPIKGCIQMNVNGKNASSTGYQLQESGFSLQRTGQ